MNPNNCATCDHKRHPDGGHCYMFRHEPQEACRAHTIRLLPRNPAMDAVVKGIHGSPAFTVANAAKAVAAALSVREASTRKDEE